MHTGGEVGWLFYTRKCHLYSKVCGVGAKGDQSVCAGDFEGGCSGHP